MIVASTIFKIDAMRLGLNRIRKSNDSGTGRNMLAADM